MVEANMTQEEIDLLLNNVDSLAGEKTTPTRSQAQQKSISLSPMERDKISDAFLQGLNNGTIGLSNILNTDILISNPYSEIRETKDILRELRGKNVIFKVELKGPISGNLFFIIPNQPAKKISNLLMASMEEGNDEPLDPAQLATIKDTLSSLVYSVVSYLSAEIRQTISPIGFNVLNGSDFTETLTENSYSRTQFNFEITNYADTKITIILPGSSAKQLVNLLQKTQRGSVVEDESQIEETRESKIPIQEVEFPSISTTSQGLATPNTNLLLDVQMTITVELGRTKKYIKEILEMGEGSVIELQKQAGEHVDILVNGKLIARGEVVVIDENFGVRVTEIISAKDKLGMRKQQ